MGNAYIVDACRTPRGIGKVGKGALAHLHPSYLGSTVLAAMAERNNLNTAEVDDIIWGTSSQTGKQGGDLGRMAALNAGYDVRSSGVTLDRFLWLGHYHREPRRGADHVGHGRPGDRRWYRDDELPRPDCRPVYAAHDRLGQPGTARHAPPVTAGCLCRCDCHP